MRHKGKFRNQIFDSKEEQLKPLCRNKVADSCSSLDFLDTSAEGISEEEIFKYLAEIISSIYLKKICMKKKQEKKQ